jgi:hypothetical protein
MPCIGWKEKRERREGERIKGKGSSKGRGK